MTRGIVFLALLPVLWFGGRAVLRAIVPDETLIRWEIEEMQEGYNSGDVGDAVSVLDDAWRHRGYELDREMLHAGLVREFFQDRDPVSKKLRRRVDMEEDSLKIEAQEDDASLEVEVWFSRLDDEQWTEGWRARIEAKLHRTEEGWRIVESSHEDVRGTSVSR